MKSELLHSRMTVFKVWWHKNHLVSLSKNMKATLCPEFSRTMYIFAEAILLMKLTSILTNFSLTNLLLNRPLVVVTLHWFSSPTHRCVFLLYMLSLLTLTFNAWLRRWILSYAVKEKMAQKHLYISKAMLKYNQFMIMNVSAEWHCRLSVFKWSGKICTLLFEQR